MEEEAETSKQDWKTPLIVIAVIVGVALIVGAVILSNSNLTGNVVNDGSQNSQASEDSVFKKNCRQEQVPYEEREAYETIECNQEPLKYNKEVTACRESVLYIGNAKASCMITNLDSEYGLFEVTANLNCGDGQWFKASQKMSLSPYDSDTFSYADISFCEDVTCTCDVEPSTKQVCKNVIKYRTITKYRTEEVCN